MTRLKRFPNRCLALQRDNSLKVGLNVLKKCLETVWTISKKCVKYIAIFLELSWKFYT